MALRITLGQYYATSSLLHALDARTKVIGALAIMVSVFFIRTPLALAYAWAPTLALVMASRIPPAKVLESVRLVAIVLVMLSVFNILLVREGPTVIDIGPLVITAGGLWAAILYPLRLLVATVICALLLLSTTPTQLTDAFDALLSPFARMGIPAHELAMVFSLMLRFIPTLFEEANAIVDAQTARGANLGEGSIASRIRATISVVVALLASALRHASGLSRALDARCYVGGATRSHWHPLHMHTRDGIAFVMLVVYLVGLALLAN